MVIDARARFKEIQIRIRTKKLIQEFESPDIVRLDDGTANIKAELLGEMMGLIIDVYNLYPDDEVIKHTTLGMEPFDTAPAE